MGDDDEDPDQHAAHGRPISVGTCCQRPRLRTGAGRPTCQLPRARADGSVGATNQRSGAFFG
jgi:hypothetical protein